MSATQTAVEGRSAARADHTSPRCGRVDRRKLPIPLDGSLRVVSWPDPYLAERGHDARSSYTELFWLGILGPSSTLLLRRLATALAHNPEGFWLPVTDTSRSLGLGRPKGADAAFVRALHRLCVFHMARFSEQVLEVHTRVPTLSPRKLGQLPPSLRAAHANHERRAALSKNGTSGGATGQ